jgi:hypothetical protein
MTNRIAGTFTNAALLSKAIAQTCRRQVEDVPGPFALQKRLCCTLHFFEASERFLKGLIESTKVDPDFCARHRDAAIAIGYTANLICEWKATVLTLINTISYMRTGTAKPSGGLALALR